MKVTMKIDIDAKAKLKKAAGAIQAKEGGSVTLADAVTFITEFYKENNKQ